MYSFENILEFIVNLVLFCVKIAITILLICVGMIACIFCLIFSVQALLSFLSYGV